MTTHPPQPGSLAEAVEVRAEAVAQARELPGGRAELLQALTTLLNEIAEAENAGELLEPYTDQAGACAEEILDLCAELAREPDADLVELAGTVGAAVERYGWIDDTAQIRLVAPALRLLTGWAVTGSSGVVLECGRAAAANIDLLAEADRFDEALMHSQRLLLAYERHFATDPALFRWHLADAHGKHAHLLVCHGLKHAAVAHSERAVALALTVDLDEHDITDWLTPLLEAHIRRLRTAGDLDAARAAVERLLDVLPDPSPERARALTTVRTDLTAGEDTTAAIAAAEREIAAWQALPDQPLRLSQAFRALAGLQSREKQRDEAADTAMRALAIVEAAHAAKECGREPVAATLRQVVVLLLRAGRHTEALAHSDRELAAWRELFDAMGERNHEPWANASNNRAVALNHLDRHTESLEHSANAVAHYDLLATTRPDHRAALANALFTRHAALRDLREYVSATTCTNRMMRIYDELAEADPDDHPLERAESRQVHAGLLSAMGRHRPAMHWSARAIELFDALIERYPGKYTAQYAGALTSRLVVLQAAGEPPRALLRVSGKAADLENRLHDDDPGRRWSQRAMALTNHAICLSSAGRLREAAACSAEAVAACEDAPEGTRDARRLAECLDKHGNHLDALGRHEEALASSTRAMAVYDELLATDRNLFLADAAAVMDNHAAKLAATGRLDEAITRSRESVAMFAELAAEGLWRKAYGVALANLAHRLKAADHPDEAVEPSAHSLRLRTELAETGGPELRADLGQASLNHGHTLGLTGDTEGARHHTAEAVAILDDMVELDRPAYLALLAQAVHNLASYQDGDEAAETSRRAVELRHEQVATDRELHLPELATSLKYAVKYHDRAGQADRAEEYARTEIDVCDELPDRRARAELRQALANRLMRAGRRAEAVAPIGEAVALARALTAADRPAHVDLLRNTLSDSAWILCDGEPHAALAATTECLALSEELDGDYDLAHALDGHGSMLAELGRHAEALDHYARALPLWEAIAADGRPSAIGDVAWCRTFRSISLAALGRDTEALEESATAVTLYTGLPRMRADLAFAEQEHALRLHAVGRTEEAKESATTALARYEELTAEAPAAHRPQLANALLTAAIVGAGDPRELAGRALAAYREVRAADPGAYAAKVRAAAEFLRSLG
ncbi:tetratricopeptide repeat protein [Phytomonospora endophytica]|uniref:Tetratricopeptide (TPR) repeat protein n=1 Tax=Phytomonospora endophytica TaxID=714109 RepID=A0A841G206_9ACTN|nr:tetratricopeptide repeat protein [Phytomonospora endophytica]MBB6038729.1 tetratricopeptide (TPR) repeat protein [Phytomonospora endophytica]